MRDFLARLWWCRIWRFHSWTSAVQQGALHRLLLDHPLKDLQPGEIIPLFHKHSRMWCIRCGHFSELNNDKSTEPVKYCRPWHNGLPNFKHIPPPRA